MSVTSGFREVYVHGPDGLLTGGTAKKGNVEVVLPPATIAGVSPGTWHVAWDGGTYRLMPTLESIQETDRLTLIGSVTVPAFSLLADNVTALGGGHLPGSALLIMADAATRRGQQTERPPLPQLTLEATEQLLHRIDQIHWPLIAKMRVPKFIPLDTPVPPRTPQILLGQIVWYASRLFKEEAEQYKAFHGDAAYSGWLQRLAERVMRRVVVALNRLEEGDPKTLLMSYHGLSQKEMEKGLRKAFMEFAESYVHSPSGTMATPAYAPLRPKTQQIAEPAEETIGSQIERFRTECDVTVEMLAEALQVDVRQIYRHQAGTTVPRKTHIAAYQKFFSEKLNRPVTLRTSAKRQVKRNKRQ